MNRRLAAGDRMETPAPWRREAVRLALAGVVVVALGAALAAGGCRDEAAPSATAPSATSPAGEAARGPVVPSAPPVTLDAARAAHLLSLPLACVDRAWPNKPSHVYDDPVSFLPPEAVTPAFAGCFDWHSAVHGHWTMVRLLRRFPAVEGAAEARAALARRLSSDNLARERTFFAEQRTRTFERPYGWAWLLRLQAELASWDDPLGRTLAARLRPLADLLAARLVDYLERLSLPIRVGTHANTAYALAHALDHARTTGDRALAAAIERRARDFYAADSGCPTDYEPSGEDFLSPCLAEADLMRRVLPRDELVPWLDRFLPPLAAPRFAPLLAAPEVRDRKDPRIGHLIGLCFHRAAAYGGLADALPAADPRATDFRRLAARHVADGLRLMEDSGYGGEHWLGTFAVFALTE